MYEKRVCPCGRVHTIEISKGNPKLAYCQKCSRAARERIARAVLEAGKTNIDIQDLHRVRRARSRARKGTQA